MVTCTPAPGHVELFCLSGNLSIRDQRLLNTARLEVEKCAVVRTLVKQKGHLQKTIARQERELEAIKQTQVRVKLVLGVSLPLPKTVFEHSTFGECCMKKFHVLVLVCCTPSM